VYVSRRDRWPKAYRSSSSDVRCPCHAYQQLCTYVQHNAGKLINIRSLIGSCHIAQLPVQCGLVPDGRVGVCGRNIIYQTRKRTHDSWQVLLHKTQGAPGHEHPTGFRVRVTSSCSCVPVAGVFNSRYAATYTTVHSVQWIPLALWAQVGLVQTAHKVEDNATEYSFIMPRIRPTIAL
jgi:hypothetical protein